MDCRAWEDLLQQHLDGGPPEALPQHLRECSACAVHRAELTRLLDGLSRLTPPTPPPGFSDRLTGTLLREARDRKRSRRRVRLTAFAGVAAAAAVLLAVGLYAWPRPEKERPSEGTHAEAVEPPPPPLRDNVALAGDAVASLTKNTAKDTAEQSSALLSAIEDTTEPLTRVPPPVEPKLDRPMREAADSVSDGLSPVRDSARRAVGLFMRDLPVAKSDKPLDKTE